MRSRNIKPGFFKSEGLASCSVQARLLFIGLWCMADREGKLEDRPLRIKAELFPYDNVNVDKLLEELASKKDCDGTPSFIVRYGTQKKYIHIIHFLSHQNPHIKEQRSVIPDFTPCTMQVPDKNSTSTEQAGLNPDSLLLNPDILIPSTSPKAQDRFPEFWAEYPNKVSKQDCIKLWEKIKPGEYDAVITGVKRYVQSKKVQEGFVMGPDKWLRGRRWEDEVTAGGSNERVLRSKHEQGSSTGHSGDGNSASKIPEGFWG